MSLGFDPITMALVGGGLGAATSDDPLKGALLGGLGGFAGGHLMGAGNAANMAGASTGLTAGGNQAAMLAAQNMGMGAGADLATKAALASNPMLGMTAGTNAAIAGGASPSLLAPQTMGKMYQAGANAGFNLSGNQNGMMRAGQMIQKQGEQPKVPQMPIISPASPPPPKAQFSNLQAGIYPQMMPQGFNPYFSTAQMLRRG